MKTADDKETIVGRFTYRQKILPTTIACVLIISRSTITILFYKEISDVF
jgi:hypothetical protein